MKDPSDVTRQSASRSKSKGLQSKIKRQRNANALLVADRNLAIAVDDPSKKPLTKKMQSRALERNLAIAVDDRSKRPLTKKMQSKALERKLKRLRRRHPTKDQVALQRRRRVERAIRRMRLRRQYYTSPRVHSNQPDLIGMRPYEMQGLRAADHLGAERRRDSPTDWGQHDLDFVDAFRHSDGSLTPLSVGSYSPGGRHSVESITWEDWPSDDSTTSPAASPAADVTDTLTQRLPSASLCPDDAASVSPDGGIAAFLSQTTADDRISASPPATPSEGGVPVIQAPSTGLQLLRTKAISFGLSSEELKSPTRDYVEELKSPTRNYVEELKSPTRNYVGQSRSAAPNSTLFGSSEVLKAPTPAPTLTLEAIPQRPIKRCRNLPLSLRNVCRPSDSLSETWCPPCVVSSLCSVL